MRLMQHLEEDTKGLKGYLITTAVLIVLWLALVATLLFIHFFGSPNAPTIRPQQKIVPEQSSPSAGVRIGVQVGEPITL